MPGRASGSVKIAVQLMEDMQMDVGKGTVFAAAVVRESIMHALPDYLRDR
jgi:hypothetical protein